MINSFVEMDGIKCYAPEFAAQSEGFDIAHFEKLSKVEEINFWFRIRNKIIIQLFSKYVRIEQKIKFMEIGCGNGYVLKGLSDFKNLELTGSEIFMEGLKFARQRLPGVELIQMDATNMPFEKKFDVVGAFDVLEHITADEKVMQMVNRALTDSGIFLISVPQYPWMWSAQDDLAFHKRRYTRKELSAKLARNGFTIEYMSSFVFTLFPVMIVSRYFKKGSKHDAMTELEIPKLLNAVFFVILYIDYLLIQMGISLPFGGSLICVARKNKDLI